MTGGSLEESKEALAIAETDGVCLYLIVFPIFVLLSVLFFMINFLNCLLLEMGFHWLVSCLSQEGFSVQWGCTQPDAKLIIFLQTPLVLDCTLNICPMM